MCTFCLNRIKKTPFIVVFDGDLVGVSVVVAVVVIGVWTDVVAIVVVEVFVVLFSSSRLMSGVRKYGIKNTEPISKATKSNTVKNIY